MEADGTNSCWQNLGMDIWSRVMGCYVLNTRDKVALSQTCRALRSVLEYRESCKTGSIFTAYPRYPFEADVKECSKTLRNFKALRSISLPRLDPSVHLDLMSLSRFKCLMHLELTGTKLHSDSIRFDEKVLPNLRALTLTKLTLPYCLLESIPGLTKLDCLSMNSLSINDYKTGFIGKLSPQLSKLVLDQCVQITSYGQLDELRKLSGLREISLGVEELSEEDMQTIGNLESATFSLTLYGQQSVEDYDQLSTIANIVSLKFDDVSDCWFPQWVEHMPNLIELSLNGGRVSFDDVDLGFLPESLKSLSLSVSYPKNSDIPSLLEYSKRLNDLHLQLPTFVNDINLGILTNLISLSISGKEDLDGNVLKNLCPLTELKYLRIKGCSYLDVCHMRSVAYLKSLSRLFLLRCGLTIDSSKFVEQMRVKTSLECCSAVMTKILPDLL